MHAGSRLSRIDRLVALLVFQLLLDVGRQGHLPHLVQQREEDALIGKAHQPVSVLFYANHLPGEEPLAKDEAAAFPGPLARLAQDLPGIVPFVFQQQKLHMGPRVLLNPIDAGGQHPGVVEDKAVARAQKLADLIKMMVAHPAGAPVQDHQPGSVPRLHGGLGNQLLGQIIIKIVRLQCVFLHSVHQSHKNFIEYPG